MTYQGKQDYSAEDASIVEYLRAHPGFFERNRALLKELVVPHDSGDAVSLIERQLAVIREENSALKQRLEQLIDIAKANEALNARIHALALELMAASGPQAIFTALRERLRTVLRAEGVAVRIFAEPAFIDDQGGREFVGRTSTRRGPFAQMLEAAKPQCGHITRLQSEALFDREQVGSAVVLPLRGKHWDGVLGMRSDNAQRFEADMGTELLTYLAEVATRIIEPWVAKRP
ncbi:MAG: DUF484 family protein [Gammaproteobacteria bacterium]|nr:DUF484 family protein [Gammaproteobacteria bacterium]